MSILQRKKYFLAFHHNHLALISKEKEHIKIIRLNSFTEDVKPLYTLRSLLEGKTYETVTGLNTDQVLFRKLNLKLTSKKEVFAALPFQIEEILPYPSEDALLIPRLHPKKESTDVSFFASSKTILEKHLEEMNSIGVDPDTVSAVPMGLYRFISHYYPQTISLIAFHQNTFIVVEEGKLVWSQSIKKGDFPRILAYAQKKYPEIEHFFSYKNEDLPITINRLEPPNLDIEPYVFAIGLAIDRAKQDKMSCQFRIGSLQSKNVTKKRKKDLLTYFASCALFILIALVMSRLHLEKREKVVLHAIDAKQGHSLREAISELEDSIHRKRKTTFTLPTIPKVHEVLTYLSTHPALLTDGSINHLRYEIVKMPRLGSHVKTYNAKVEVELTCENPSTARDFHRAIVQDCDFIDQKQEVRWSGDHGIYHATFYLKPQKIK